MLLATGMFNANDRLQDLQVIITLFIKESTYISCPLEHILVVTAALR